MGAPSSPESVSQMRMLRLAAVGVLLLAGCQAPGSDFAVRAAPAERPLPIPPLMQGRVDASGTAVFELTAQRGRTDFGQRGGPADTIGLNGGYLGPTLRMADGEEVAARVENTLDEMTTLHWHGMHVPARSDGGPHSMIQPGDVWQPRWTVDQPAATLWYHSHPHGETAQQVYRGLAGMIIIDDDSQAGRSLPSQYGVDDIPLIVQDKSFTADGQLIVDPEGGPSTGFLGDQIVVNGAMGTYVDVTTEAVRLRLLNASNARVYDFGFDDGRRYQVVASDGGLLPAPVTTDSVVLTPGERAEVVVRLSPGETVMLRSAPPRLGTTRDDTFSPGTFPVVELRAAENLAPSPPVDDALADLPEALEDPSATVRTFGIEGRAINGRPMDMNRIDMAVPVDRTEIWELTNQDPQPHNFHVHNVQFRVLSMDGRSPPAVLAGYKDTVYVAPRTTVRIQLRFNEYTDRNWPYMFHCHLLLHEDMGVMGQFVVVRPGQTAGRPPQHGQDRVAATAIDIRGRDDPPR
jgi:FtsP/CotA-like multicopper oxidase with cupredoxin domain